jgi:GH24 family phage-related lysozyme (muramidase)
MALNDELIEFIGKEEGISLSAYLDPRRNTINQYSIGYGHLIKPEEIQRGYLLLADNTQVSVLGIGGGQTVITQPQANSLLIKDLEYYRSQTERIVGATTWAKLSDSQKTALVSYTYNAGPGSVTENRGFAGFYNRSNGFKPALESGNYVRAGEILRDTGVRTATVNNVREVVPALVNRRKREGQLIAGQVLAGSTIQVSIPDTTTSTSTADYFESNYIKPINEANFNTVTAAITQKKVLIQFNTLTESIVTPTPLQEVINRIALTSDSQLDGELLLLRGASEVSAQFVSETNAALAKVENLLPSEAAYLVTFNLFEPYPDLMRQKLSANAGTPSNAVDYSHAWRAPGKLAITANLTIPGASGFRIGQIFRVGRTYDSYNKFGAFQLFGLTETIDLGRGWTTQLYARFNAMPTFKIQGLQSE